MKITLLVFAFLLTTIVLTAQCDFSISNSQPCAGEFVTFTISNPDGSTYGWDFDGDDEPDAFGINTGYTFPTSFENENYTITLYDDDEFCEGLDIIVLAAPDVSIGVVPGGDAEMNGNNIRACNESAEVTLELFNNSQTCINNTLYEINWGDGTPVETHTNTTFPCDGTGIISHPYSGFGYKIISITVTRDNGCVNTENFTFYSGGNPSISFSNPGNTTGLCGPATISFPIGEFEDNPAGTEYFIYVNNELVASFDQNNIPTSFEYIFDETSCGVTTLDGLYNNAFDIRMDAVNPCGSSTEVVEPIEVSTLPQASFIIDEPENGCPEEIWTFTDNSTGINEVISGNPTECINELLASWTITPNQPGVAWNVISGNLFGATEIEIEFLLPGTYTIEMTLNSQACGPSMVTQTIFVLEPPTADAEIVSGVSSGCAPQTLTFNNLSSGPFLNYQWTILPPTGWTFIDGTNENSENPTIQFDAAGNYTITLTTSNTCDEDIWTTTAMYASTPSVLIDTIPDACQVATLNFNTLNVSYNANGEPITTYAWSFPGGIPSSSSDPYPTGIEYNTSGQHIVTCTVTNICGSYSTSDTFYIESPVALSLPDDMTLCEDDPSFALSADPPGGVWAGTGVLSGNIFDPSQALDSNILTYTYGDCVSTGTIVIMVNELPAINISNNITSACVSVESVTLNATPDSGTWTVNNGGVINGNVFSPAQSGSGNYILTYTYLDLITDCDVSDQFMFEVFPLPEISVSDTSYCNSPGLVNLPNASPMGGAWSGPGVIGDQFDPQAVDVQMNNILTYSYTNGSTLCDNSVNIIVTVEALQSLEVAEQDTLCAEPIAFDLNTLVDPQNGTWDANGSNGLDGSVFNPAEAGVGLHTLTYTIGSGNCEVSDDLMIQVNALPLIEINDNVTSACVSVESVPLVAFPLGGNWASNNGGILSDDIFYPEASGIGVYTLTYSFTDSMTLCSNTEQITFTVNPLPNVQSNDTIYCNLPGLVNLPDAIPLGGEWSGNGVMNNQLNPTSIGINTVELTYTYSDGDGCTDSTTVMVEVVAPIDIDAGPDTVLCSNQGPYPLGGSPSGTGTWSGSGVIDNIFYPHLAGDGIHTLYYSINQVCLVQDFIEIEVIDEVIMAGPNEDVCITDDSFSLEGGNNPTGGTWSGSGVTGIIFDPMEAGIGTHEIIYTYIEPVLGCTFDTSRIITVHDLANSDFSFEPDSSCIGQSVQFTNFSTNTDNPLWDFGDGNFSTEIHPMHIYQEVGVYEVKLLNSTNFGCSDSTSQTILIDESPTPSFDIELIPSCEGVTVVLSNPIIDGDTYELDYDIGSSINEWTDTIFYEGQQDTTIYNISLTSTNYCGPGTFNVDPIVVPPIFNASFGVIPLNNQDNIFCSPFDASFANISTGQIDSFFFFYGTGDSSINIIDTFTYVNTTDSIITFTATLIIYGGDCVPDTAQTEISLLPVNFTAAFNVSDTIICENETLMINDFTTPTTLIQYYKFDMGNGDTIVIDPDDVNDFEYVFPEPGTFLINLTASDGCTESSYAIPITVVAIPEASFNIQDEGCTGEEIIMVVGLADSLLSISLNINNDTIFYSMETQYIFDTPGEYPITLTVTDLISGCSTVVSKDILIRENVGLPLLISERVTCDVLELELIGDNVDTVIWGDDSFDNPEADTSVIKHQYSEPGNYFVELFNIDSFGCKYKETYAVEVFENDLEVDAGSDIRIPLGETAMLNNVAIEGTGPYSYLWTPSQLVEDSISEQTETTILLDDTEFILSVSSLQGCIARDELIVRLENEKKIYIPNVFSPNEDLINDWFTVYAGPEVDYISKMIIFDRWGEKVFEKENFPPNEEDEGWDGYFKGEVMNPQVFVYYIEVEYINGDLDVFPGDVTLVK